MNDVVLGIDLGTTNSAVAVADAASAHVLPDADGQLLLPSVVSFHPNGRVLIGQVARERRLLDARNTVYATKRLIGRPFASPEVRRARERFAFELVEGPRGGVEVIARGERWTLPEISAYVLRGCRERAEAAIGYSCAKAVVTVPANFNELQRSATQAACTIAGLDVLRVLNEPTAAALAYGYGSDNARRIAVYDLGGGTFDITILELEDDVFEVIATAGDTFLGGDDIDLLLAELMCDQLEAQHRWDPRTDAQAFERLRAAGEWAKCMLSTEHEVRVQIPELSYGPDGMPIDFTLGLTRRDLEDLVRPLVDRSTDVCRDAMRLAGCIPEDIDRVVLVGGSTRIPFVRQRVAEVFDTEPRTDYDPDLVVALGAAIQGRALAPLSAHTAKTVPPPPAKVEEVRRAKEAARAERPEQPAFAPIAIASLELRRVTLPGGGAAVEEVAPSPRLVRGGEDVWAEPERRASSRSKATLPGLTARPPGFPVAADSERTAIDAGDRVVDSGPALPSAPPRLTPSAGLYRAEVAITRPRRRPEATAGLHISKRPQSAHDPADINAAGRRGHATSSPAAPRLSEPTPATGVTRRAAIEANEPLHPVPVAPDLGRRPSGRAADPELESILADLPLPDLEIELDPSPLPALPPVGASSAFASASTAAYASRDKSQQVSEAWTSAPTELPPGKRALGGLLLMDVTPLSLGIETVGGYCEQVIRRNAPVPVEQTRIFSTATDNQASVRLAICQGESRLFEDNQALGAIELTGLRSARRGEVRIEVTFMLDANGALDVRATDVHTRVAQSIRIELVGGYGADELAALKARQEATLGDG